MLILPIIDLLVLSGTGFLVIGFLLKAVTVLTGTNPTILGFSSIDFVLMTGVCWAFALVLAARSWVKLHEPNLESLRRAQLTAIRKESEGSGALTYDESEEPLPEHLQASNDTAGVERS